jgi:hypothetical protein
VWASARQRLSGSSRWAGRPRRRTDLEKNIQRGIGPPGREKAIRVRPAAACYGYREPPPQEWGIEDKEAGYLEAELSDPTLKAGIRYRGAVKGAMPPAVEQNGGKGERAGSTGGAIEQMQNGGQSLRTE